MPAHQKIHAMDEELQQVELEGQRDNWESDEYVDESEDNLEIDNDEVDKVMDQAVLESDTEEA